MSRSVFGSVLTFGVFGVFCGLLVFPVIFLIVSWKGFVFYKLGVVFDDAIRSPHCFSAYSWCSFIV